MTGQRSQLINFVSKFMGAVRFGNDHVATIMGYGDYQIGNVMISRVYYVEGLGHNLFSVDLLKGSRGTNLYTLSLEEMMQSSPVCLLSKASKTKSWLWHRRLSYLNFGAINDLAKQGLVRGLPKLKYQKDHFINRKKYIMVIVDDYVTVYLGKVLRSKDETLEIVIKILKKIQVRLNATVRNIRTDNEIEFVNQKLKAYYEDVGISHQTSIARTPQQNGSVVSSVPAAAAPRPADPTDTPSSTYIDQDAPSASTLPTQKTQSPVIHSGVEEQLNENELAQFDNDPFLDILTSEPSS
ncbi:retrovirus-related pol polyprotein from transposon TNT 1-94 [Tanacetum coccineum]